MLRSISGAGAALVAVSLLWPFAGTACAQSTVLSESTRVTVTSSALASGGVELTALVTTAQGAGVPGGSIQFIDETSLQVLGWAEAARPSIVVAGLPVGRHAIRADYRGTDAFLPLIVEPSQSAPLILNVLARPAVTLSTLQNPCAPGELVTLIATVAGAPGGAVTFRDGATVLAAHVALDRNGTASFTSSSLAEGGRALVAEYEGDGEHQAAVSAPLLLQVTAARLSDAEPRGM